MSTALGLPLALTLPQVETPFALPYLTGLEDCHDPEQGVTLNGSTVSAWTSTVGGTTHTLAQAVGANRPLFTTSNANYNGHSTVTFNGSSHYLATPSFASAIAAPQTYYWVGEMTSFNMDYGFWFDGDSNRPAICVDKSGSKLAIVTGSLGENTLDGMTKSVFCVRVNDWNSTIYKNSPDGQTAHPSGAPNLAQLIVAANYVPAEYTPLTLAYECIYTGSHDWETRALIMGALGERFGITIT